jgi:DNA-directed RNA polymerase specialized sigma24 family protein
MRRLTLAAQTANRLKLAAEAREISRQIWASFPLQARRAYAVQQVMKIAFGDDYTSLGLAILKAMDNAGIDGSIAATGKKVSDLQLLIRKNRAGSLKKYADVLGKIAANSIKGMDEDAREEAFSHVIILLTSRGLDSGKTFEASMKYVQQVLKNKALDKIKGQGRRQEIQHEMSKDDIREFMGNPRLLKKEIPTSMWDKAMKAVLKAPELQINGEPRAYQYIQGVLNGLSKVEIAEQMGLAAPALEKWFKDPDRLDALGEIFEEAYFYLSSDAA